MPASAPNRRFVLNRVFLVSLVIVAAFGAWGLIDPEGMSGTSLGFTTFMLNSIGWYWLLVSTGFLILAGFLAFGPYGRVRLGDDDEEPEFSTISWIAMLFAGGMGAGLIFWGVAEPLYHFRAPPGMPGGTPDAARAAFKLTNLHWGLHAWAASGIGPPGPKAGRRPPLIRTSAMNASGSSGLWFHCILE